MKKYVLVLFIVAAVSLLFLFFRGITCPLSRPAVQAPRGMDIKASESEMLRYLKERNDLLAAQKAEVVLSVQPGNICALWAKAEIYRRAYDFNESKKILNRILAASPGYPPALITLAYIDYHDNRFREALSLLKQALNSAQLGREDKAIAYMLIGSVNAKRAKQGGLFNKIAYGTRILGYFEKARAFAPGLAEVRLGLGSFYLLAPRIAGGNIDLAIEELKRAVDLAPDFATANARLAQAYREKGDMDKYNFYISRAKKLDPANEVVVELEGRI